MGGADEWAARYLVLAASNRLIPGDFIDGRWQNTGIGGTTHGGAEFATPVEDVAARVEALAALPWPVNAWRCASDRFGGRRGDDNGRNP